MLNRRGIGLTSREEQELQLAVANGTSQSGGRREDLLTAMALDERLRSIGNELEHQYQVTYARPRTLIPPKSLEVSVKRPGVCGARGSATSANARIATNTPIMASAA
jgi:hypothetical protein